jgi:Arc/MetJ-type ribon-helix-helix transcriptional regulator
MNTVPIELPDDMKSFLDRKVSNGEYPNRSALVQRLIAKAMELDAQWRSEVERKLHEALDEEAQGLEIPWTRERHEEMLNEHRERMAKKREPR